MSNRCIEISPILWSQLAELARRRAQSRQMLIRDALYTTVKRAYEENPLPLEGAPRAAGGEPHSDIWIVTIDGIHQRCKVDLGTEFMLEAVPAPAAIGPINAQPLFPARSFSDPLVRFWEK